MSGDAGGGREGSVASSWMSTLIVDGGSPCASIFSGLSGVFCFLSDCLNEFLFATYSA